MSGEKKVYYIRLYDSLSGKKADVYPNNTIISFLKNEKRLLKRAKERGEEYHESLDEMEENGRGIAASESIHDIVEKKILFELLHKAVMALPDKEREIIDAYYFNGMSEPQISAETGIPQQTINDRRKAIEKKLGKKLK